MSASGSGIRRPTRKRKSALRLATHAQEAEIDELLQELGGPSQEDSEDRDASYNPYFEDGQAAPLRPKKKRKRRVRPPPPPPLASTLTAAFASLMRVPAFVEQLARVDDGPIALRSAKLAAKDIGSAAVAMGLQGEDLAPAWQHLAATCCGYGLPENQPSCMYQACVRTAIRMSNATVVPIRRRKAKWDYDLTEADLKDVKLLANHADYSLADVQAVAHAKYGDYASLQAVRSEARRLHQERMKQRMERRMHAVGVPLR